MTTQALTKTFKSNGIYTKKLTTTDTDIGFSKVPSQRCGVSLRSRGMTICNHARALHAGRYERRQGDPVRAIPRSGPRTALHPMKLPICADLSFVRVVQIEILVPSTCQTGVAVQSFEAAKKCSYDDVIAKLNGGGLDLGNVSRPFTSSPLRVPVQPTCAAEVPWTVRNGGMNVPWED